MLFKSQQPFVGRKHALRDDELRRGKRILIISKILLTSLKSCLSSRLKVSGSRSLKVSSSRSVSDSNSELVEVMEF